MTVASAGTEQVVAARAARGGAGLLLAVMLACLMSGGNSDRPATARRALQIDPNTATRAELMLLPDVGEVRAEAILAERGANGRIESELDLDRVRGIGPRRIEKLRPHLRLESAAREQP